MFGYERGILSRSQARMRRGSPLCETQDSVRDITTLALQHFIRPVLAKPVCLQMTRVCFFIMFFTVFQSFWQSGLYFATEKRKKKLL